MDKWEHRLIKLAFLSASFLLISFGVTLIRSLPHELRGGIESGFQRVQANHDEQFDKIYKIIEELNDHISKINQNEKYHYEINQAMLESLKIMSQKDTSSNP